MHQEAMYKAAEYHSFALNGTDYLFNVNNFNILHALPVDLRILQLATTPITLSELQTIDSTETKERVTILIQAKFLLQGDEQIGLPELGRPTNYVTFMVNVMQRCNLTCPYCYVNKGLFDYEEKPIARMTAETASSLVDNIHANFPDFETYGYHFYGGEPLMNYKTIQQVVAFAEQKAIDTGTKVEYHITTNGTLLNKEVADFMNNHHFTVYFSIDGSKETHDELRRFISGKGSFDVVVKNLEYLKTRPNVHLIGSSVIREGFTLKDAIQNLVNYGASQCKAERVRIVEKDELALKGDSHDNYINDIKSALYHHYIEYLDNWKKPLDFRLSAKILQLLTKKRRNFFCTAGERMFGVSANGELYPCALHVGRALSKLGSLNEGLHEQKRAAFRASFSSDHQKECQTCWTRHLCGGGCSAMVDRFGHEDCKSLRSESEAAIAVYDHFVCSNPTKIYSLVSPSIAKWVNDSTHELPS